MKQWKKIQEQNPVFGGKNIQKKERIKKWPEKKFEIYTRKKIQIISVAKRVRKEKKSFESRDK